MEITDEPVYLLLEAIIKCACDDYRNALRGKCKHHLGEFALDELTQFFESDFCESTLGVSGTYIKEQLDKEYKEELAQKKGKKNK